MIEPKLQPTTQHQGAELYPDPATQPELGLPRQVVINEGMPTFGKAESPKNVPEKPPVPLPMGNSQPPNKPPIGPEYWDTKKGGIDDIDNGNKDVLDTLTKKKDDKVTQEKLGEFLINA